MDITTIQNDLKTKGYTHFNLADYDKELYNFLLPLRCNQYTSLKKFMTGIRVDGKAKPNSDNILGIHLNETYDTFEIASEKLENGINAIETDGMFQAWYCTETTPVLNARSLDKNLFKTQLFKMVKECFGLDEKSELFSIVDTFTYYDTKCKILNHQDGNVEDRVCSLLIYLNQNYDINDGGCLILENETLIEPIFGNVAMISLDRNFNVNHQVTEVINGMGRYAICLFIKEKGNVL